MKKSDFFAGLVIGEAIAWLLFLIARHIAANPEPGKETVPFIHLLAGEATLFVLTFALPVLAVGGLYVAHALASRLPFLWQLAKFSLVGVLNFLLNLGTLNLFIYLSGINEGRILDIFKVFGFVVANINSFSWNKFWTFQDREIQHAKTEFVQFVGISLIGLIIDVTIFDILVNGVGAPETIQTTLWNNIGSVAGSVGALIWNFLGYKFVVFKKVPQTMSDSKETQA